MKLFRQLRNLLRRGRLDAEIAEEMQAHIELQTRRNLSAGMEAEEARYAALRQFGNVVAIQERAREQRGVPALESLVGDFRLAWRGLWRAPGFAMAVISILALGLAFSMAGFHLISVVLNPLRVPEPERLVRVWSAGDANRVQAPQVSWLLFERLCERSDIFADGGATVPTGFTYMDGENPVSVGGVRATSGVFRALGVPLLRGRLFTAAEEASGGPQVVLVSPAFWRGALGGREDAIGRAITLDGIPHEVIGVVAEEIAQLEAGNSVWLPRPFDLPGVTRERIQRGGLPVQALFRLRAGVSLAQADAALQSVKRAYTADYPANGLPNVFLRDYRLEIAGAARPTAWVLMAAAGSVLLLAIMNAGGLWAARALQRRQDVAVRLAIGGSALRVAGGFAAEVMLAVLLAAGAGALLVQWLIPVADRAVRTFMPRLPALSLDAGAWIFGLCVAVATLGGLVLVPLVQVMHTTVSGVLTGCRNVTRGGRAQAVMVTFQVAVTTGLLISAVVLLASYRRLSATSPGFEAGDLTTGFVNLPVKSYPTAERQATFFQEVLAQLRMADGSLQAAFVSVMPLSRELRGQAFRVVGRPAPPEEEQPAIIQRGVSDGYFDTMRIPLRAGRAFSSADRTPGHLVGVINESLARRLFGGESALGHRLVTGSDDERGSVEIIGVVGDVRSNGLASGPTDEIYRPFQQGTQAAFVIRSGQDAAYVKDALARAVKSIDPQRAVAVFQAADDLVARSASAQRLAAATTGVFAAAAVLLAAVGLYGLVAGWVAQRSRELGVRVALGASGADIQRLVLGQGIRLALCGVLLGTIAYLLAHKVVEGILFAVSPTDPFIIGVTLAGLIAVAMVACFWPARRATKVDPMIALRAE